MRRVGPSEVTLGAIAAEAGVTASALVQRFGSKRELMLAHWRQAPASSARPEPRARTRSPLGALRATAALWAKLAASPGVALRNRAYMHHDWADPALRPYVLRHARAARARYETLVAEASLPWRAAGRYGRKNAGANDRGHTRWVVLGVDPTSGRARGGTFARGSRDHAPALSCGCRKADQLTQHRHAASVLNGGGIDRAGSFDAFRR